MTNKHSPKKGSADFGTVEHYHFEVQPKMFYKIRYLTQNGWKFLEDEYTEKDIHYYLKYWRRAFPENRYEAIKCEVLND
jgi:hypothetical protein